MRKENPENDRGLVKLEDGMCIGSGINLSSPINSVQNQTIFKSLAAHKFHYMTAMVSDLWFSSPRFSKMTRTASCLLHIFTFAFEIRAAPTTFKLLPTSFLRSKPPGARCASPSLSLCYFTRICLISWAPSAHFLAGSLCSRYTFARSHAPAQLVKALPHHVTNS